jgi:predicted small lipoprotein YifL
LKYLKNKIMLKRHTLIRIGVVTVVLVMVGCGFKGPLYLPPKEIPKDTSASGVVHVVPPKNNEK